MFDFQQKIVSRDREYDEDIIREYLDGLMETFADSPEGGVVIESQETLGWVVTMAQYALDYQGVFLADMSHFDLRDVLYDLFPRKVTVEADRAGEIVAELSAFWRFIEREYQHPHARRIIQELEDGAEERLRRELADPSNYGMAKSICMMGQQAGLDLRHQEGCSH